MTDPKDAPPDEDDRGLEANVSQVSDEDWLAGHRALIASGDIPAEELGYLYEPGRDPGTVTPADLTLDRDPDEPGFGQEDGG